MRSSRLTQVHDDETARLLLTSRSAGSLVGWVDGMVWVGKFSALL